MKTETRCGTCAFAQLGRTPSGRVRNGPGRCLFVVELPKIIPWAISIKVESHTIWPDDGKECATWKALTDGSDK